MWWRAVVATCSILAAAVAFPARASAAYQVGWWLKASGSVQVVAEANHIWGEGYDANGAYLGRVFNFWWDWNCELGSVTPGNNAGTPLRILVRSPVGSGAGCLPDNGGWESFWTTYYGWHTGTGYSSGANIYSPWYVAEYPTYVFPRDPSDPAATGTTVEVW